MRRNIDSASTACEFSSTGICTKQGCLHNSPEVVQLMGKHIATLREEILSDCQGGKCLICGLPIKDGEAVLDHQHKKRVKGSGLLRGVLCRTCNVFIAKSENSAVRYRITPAMLPSVLRNMAVYLERRHYNYMHPSEKEKEPALKRSSYNKLKKYMDGIGKTNCPPYPVSKKLTVKLKELFTLYNIQPEFYK